MTRPVLALAAAAALLLGACGGDDGSSGSTGATTRATTRAAQPAPTAGGLPAGCRTARPRTPKPARSHRRPQGRLTPGRTYTVVLRTNCGAIAIRLAAARAPRTTASFAGLVRSGFYDGLTFQRISGDPSSGPFVIQGGDPLGTGTGGPGYSVVERPPADLRYTRGTVAMAKTGAEAPGTSGSQFFIVTARDAGLPPDYALVGHVVGGEAAVTRIGSVRTTADERPVAPVVIRTAILRTG